MSARPAVGRAIPTIALSAVVLPAPVRSQEASHPTPAHAEGQVVDRHQLAVLLRHALDRDRGRCRFDGHAESFRAGGVSVIAPETDLRLRPW
jgi:hypothetical protein